jgi:hypothetical protein
MYTGPSSITIISILNLKIVKLTQSLILIIIDFGPKFLNAVGCLQVALSAQSNDTAIRDVCSAVY